MNFVLQPWQLLVVILTGWLNRQQQAVIDFLLTEAQVLNETHGKRRLLLTDDQRRPPEEAEHRPLPHRRRFAFGLCSPVTLLTAVANRTYAKQRAGRSFRWVFCVSRRPKMHQRGPLRPPEAPDACQPAQMDSCRLASVAVGDRTCASAGFFDHTGTPPENKGEPDETLSTTALPRPPK